MRIGLIITNRVPLQLPEGLVFASIPIHLQIAEGLAARGHEVTVFCSEDSFVQPPLKKSGDGIVSAYALRNQFGKTLSAKYDSASVQLHYAKAYEVCERDCDIVWSHDAAQLINYAPFVKVPTVFTLHDPLDRDEYSVLPHYSGYDNHWFVSISDAQRVPMPELRYAETIYHGVDVAQIPFVADPEPYAVFFGRIIKEKGVLESIAVARKAGLPIKLIGPLGNENPAKAAYAEAVLSEVDGDQVQYLGAMTKEQLLPVVGNASVFINMIDVRESFGMVLAESMATGTPVVARNRGSVAEVVEDGVTGFVVESEDEAVAAVARIGEIDRATCRDRVDRLFSLEACIDKYEKLFQRIIAEQAGK